MKNSLSLLVILLPICVYPVFLRVPIEISHVFGLIEVDNFSWYRMWLVSITGVIFVYWTKQDPPKTIMLFLTLVMTSCLLSKFFRTGVFGTPWSHEGVLAFVGYTGIYLAARDTGSHRKLTRALEISVWTVFFFCVLQILYGNFAFFPPVKWILPNLTYQAQRWPLYSTLAYSNNLGLFCSLFFPYVVIKKKYLLAAPLLFMAICSETRGAWLSIFITTTLIGRKHFFYVALSTIILAAPFHTKIINKVRTTFETVHIPPRADDFNGRAYMWSRSINQLKHTVLLGVGPGNYGLYFPQQEKKFGNGVAVDRPHNMYVNTWINTGLISLLVLISGIVIILVNATDRGLKLGAVGFLLAGLFTDSTLCVTPYFVIFLGLMSHRKDGLTVNYQERI